jgi:polyhydroxybutyrate depolymerase
MIPEELRMNRSPRLMFGILLLLSLAPLGSWAQPSEIPRSGTYTMTPSDGIERTFRVHLPSGYTGNEAMPLVFLFHGWGGNENAFLGSKSVTALADQRGYILVAPRGLGSNEGEPNSWTFSGSDTGKDGDGANLEVLGDTDAICGPGTSNYRYPSCATKYPNGQSNTCSWTQCQSDDIQFTLELVAYVTEHLNVDVRRIYAMGGSNGGMFAWELGQNDASAPFFRAIAPLIGLPHRGYLAPPAVNQGEKLPVLVITGTRDNVVPPGGWEDPSYTITSNGSDRFYYTGATAITRSWAQAHGCSIENPAVAFDDGVRNTDCRSYCPASGDAWPAVLDCRAGMGHSYSLSWSWKLILNFFDRHSN